jgi:carbamoyl-phosphate synthase large subunit
MGGSGGGIAYNREEFEEICTRGLDLSPTSELLIDESLLGWKEFEMEVVRDNKDNCIIVCAIENFDPMGVHTGDSITVAPAQTLTDKEYQLLRDASIDVLREIGVDTGGSNVQFGINPEDGRIVVIEMNPRVSRSSALASKATGFPIAKIAAKLAVGYTLDELGNDITGGVTPASFEPSIDYVVTKIPRFTFEKFPMADARLTTQMKSVGEVMAIGRTFQESLQKAMRGLEIGMAGFDPMIDQADPEWRSVLKRELRNPSSHRLWYVADGFRTGMSIEDLFELTKIDHWFLAEIEDLILAEAELTTRTAASLTKQEWLVASSAYMYSTYEEECESLPSNRKKIMVLGGGPNRIGQGIEFDYCCVHAALAMREDGYETIMVNCNPETVSTDYDTSDRLYFEPLTLEDVLAIVEVEKPTGVIVQFGGQTPLKLADDLARHGVPIIGTSPDAIDRAEDRERFQQLVVKLGLRQPYNRVASSTEQGIERAAEIGYPIIVRPSYVLGGRAMELVYNPEELRQYMQNAVDVSNDSPVLLDRFLDQAVEVDVDAICDGENVVIGAIMQHIEQAGVHSGDSACSLPPYNLPMDIQNEIREQVKALAIELEVIGLMNVQMAVQGTDVFVIEVNPRASRTVPFVSKCIGVSLAKVAARCMAGETLASIGFTKEIIPTAFHVKESVFPFNKFIGVDPILGPEMKSTGEVMGVGLTFGEAFSKASLGAGERLPIGGRAFLSVKDSDKPGVVKVAKDLIDLGFQLVATTGTLRVLVAANVECSLIQKVNEGRPDVSDMLKNEQIDLIINTTEGRQSIAHSAIIRRLALLKKVCYTTTLTGGEAFCIAIREGIGERVTSLQDLHQNLSQKG